MSLRITGGTLGGRLVPSPDGDTTRPTTDMWRQSIFSALDHVIDVDGIRVADLFAGTGILGLEALSRGAASLISIERQGKRVRSMQTLFKDLAVADRATAIEHDVFTWLAGAQAPFDLILADPPYDLRVANRLLSHIAANAWAAPGTLVVIEHAPTEFVMAVDGWQKVWSKEKGDTAVDILQWQGVGS